MKIFLAILTVCFGVHASEIFDDNVLKNLIDLIEEHNLDLKIIASQNDYDTDGILKGVHSYSLTFPNARPSKNEKPLTEKIATDFLTLAGKQKNSAGTNLIVNDNNVVYSSQDYPDVDIIPGFLEISESISETTIKKDNFFGQYNFIIPGDDGKNETYIALTANMDIELLNSKNVSEETLKFLKDTIVKYSLIYSDKEELVLRLSLRLQSHYRDEKWQVMVNPGDHYFKVKKSAYYQLTLDTTIFIFTL